VIAVFAVGAATTAVRLLPGKAILVSHAYIGSFVPAAKIPDLRAIATELWCDSGAFTYWQRGLKGSDSTPITVETWAEFIVSNAATFDWFLALDEIGSAEGSIRNWTRLLSLVPRELHAKLVPVWHEGDPLEHLAEYAPARRLVGLGRTKGRAAGTAGAKATRAFYDLAFNEYPDGVYHLLGNSNPDTVESYPARSFDSTTWERDSAYGNTHGWPWSAVTKETRMRAYIEAISTIQYRARSRQSEQMDLILEVA